MGKARNLADLLDDNGDVKSASLDNVPASNNASALTTGTLPIARIADDAITNAKLATGITASKLTGALPAISGAALTGITEPPRKNFIINGGFTVNQRAAYTSATAVSAGVKTYVSDRWAVYIEGVNCTYNWYDTTIDSVKRRAGKVLSTGTGSSKYFHVTQQPEYESWMESKTITISGWVRTNLAGQKIRICDGVGCYLIGSTIASDGNWSYISGQHTLPSDVSSYTAFQIHPAFGTGDFTTSTYLEWAEFKVEFGSTATAYEQRSYGEELALCQRYYQAVEGAGGAYEWDGLYANGAGAGLGINFPFPVEMRASPTLTVLFNDTNNMQTQQNSVTKQGIFVGGQTSSDGRTAMKRNSSGYVRLNAEL